MSKAVSLRTAIFGVLALALTVVVACGGTAPAEPATQSTSGDSSAQQAPAAQPQSQPQQQQPASQPSGQQQAQSQAPAPTAAAAQPVGMSDASTGGAAPTAVPEPTAAPAMTLGEPVQADLRVAITPPYAENLLGWRVGGTNQGILQPMQEALFQRDYQTWEAKPMLAESWSVSPDGKEWTINLRENVPFHHEEDTFGVSDFVFSFQLWSHPEANTGFGAFWDQILGPEGDDVRSFTTETLGQAATVTEVSDSEMVWNMNRPELWIPFYASEATTDPLIYSLDYWEKNGEAAYAESPVGTGPWRHVSYQQGAKLEYERAFDDHWRINPDFDTLTFFFAEEDLTRVAMLRAKEADIAEIPRELQGEIVDAGFAITQSTLPAFMVWVGIGGQYLEDKRNADDPNTNVLVRRAMNHAIDRDALNEAFFDNKMELMANTGWHPTDPSYDPAWEIPAYDPDLSRELLAEAGYGDSGPSVEFMSGKLVGVPELTEIAVPMISWLEDVGFSVEAQIGEFQPIRTRYRAREMNSVLWTHRTGFWPAGRNMRVYFVSPALAGAVFMYEDPITEDLFSRWQSSVDETERLNLMKEAGHYMYDQNATIPLGFLFAEFGINPEVIAEYSVNNSYFGGMKGHEYTRVVRQ
ncbi:MAG: ABC transporter substrate-binding protein [Chloroflexota bacterium]|nr:ABC transporter substrate-binding protein [Chloroflexota bacterium]MDE2685534.1 ABC transporter substrate-binding protein [Chloroflexota bacterium]